MQLRLPTILILLCSVFCGIAQTPKIDSLSKLLATSASDSNRVTWLWRLAEQYQSFKPDTSLLISKEALSLARQIEYTEGESRSLATMAASLYLLGNYPDALNNYMLKLKLEEKRKSPRNYASALNNIGLMYILLGEYENALSYLYRADSTVEAVGGKAREDLKYAITINLGETYYRKKIPDSASHYFQAAYELAKQSGDPYNLGESLVNLANVLRLQKKDNEALAFYHHSIPYLTEVFNNDMLCEATLGIARIYDRLNQPDSAGFFANMSFGIAKNDGFLSRELDASAFLSQHYKKQYVYDSAFAYMEISSALKDSIMGNEKTKEAQIISSNEQLRQAEMAEQKRKAKAIRNQQLQLLLIAIFIPIFFLITLVISRIKIHVNFIRFMGIFSLLLLFEYLTILLHPLVSSLTNHKPILELIIFVVMGAGLIPLHHKLEHLLIARLIKEKHLKGSHPGKNN